MRRLARTSVAAASVTAAAAAFLNGDKLRRWLVHAKREADLKTQWEDMPERIILMRHGQSEANVDHSILATKPDNLIELTSRGRAQAMAAILPSVPRPPKPPGTRIPSTVDNSASSRPSLSM